MAPGAMQNPYITDDGQVSGLSDALASMGLLGSTPFGFPMVGLPIALTPYMQSQLPNSAPATPISLNAAMPFPSLSGGVAPSLATEAPGILPQSVLPLSSRFLPTFGASGHGAEPPRKNRMSREDLELVKSGIGTRSAP
jgi:hypothetical protein